MAAEVISALRAEPDIAGLPFEVEQVEVREARELVAELRTRHPAILYLAMKGDRERCLEEMGRRADLSGAVAAAARLEASAAGMVSRLQAAFDAPRAAAG